MKVAVYGGSFNPPTNAHVQAAEAALNVFGMDQVWIVPVETHPLGRKALIPIEVRMELLTLAFSHLRDRVRFMRRPEVYTVDLLKGLMADYHHTFRWLAGADILRESVRWHNWDEVATLGDPIYLGREGVEIPGRTFEVTLPAISSTQARTMFAQNDWAGLAQMVPSTVIRRLRSLPSYW